MTLLPFKRGQRWLDHADKALIREMSAQGEKIAAIAARVGCNTRTVAKWQQALGCTLRDRKASAPAPAAAPRRRPVAERIDWSKGS